MSTHSEVKRVGNHTLIRNVLRCLFLLTLIMALVVPVSAITLATPVEAAAPIYAFIPNSGEASVSKVDVANGTQVARYWTAPRVTPDPYDWRTSRVVMDADGNAWVLNVGADDDAPYDMQGSVVRIQADTTNLPDVNGDTLKQTNTNHAAPLAFGTDDAVQVFPVGLPGQMPRAIAIDAAGNFWIGFYWGRYFQAYTYNEALRTFTEIEGARVSGNFTPYDADVDASNKLWFISRNSTPAPQTPAPVPGLYMIDLNISPLAAVSKLSSANVYAILIDDSNPASIVVWASSYSNVLYKFVNGVYSATITIPVGTPTQEFRGMCFDNDGKIWIAATYATSQGTKVWWYNPVGGASGSVTISTSPPANPVGVGKDAAGFIWAVCRNDSQSTGYIAKIDPETLSLVPPNIPVGYRPYVYDAYISLIPQIDIQKTPDTQCVDSGSPANFTIVVTNTGNVPLTNVLVTDPLAPDCAKTIGDLAAGAADSYTCSLANVTGAFTNVATVTGNYFGTIVTDFDNADVTVDCGTEVGGDVYNTNKLGLIVPWLLLTLMVGAAGFVIARRKSIFRE